MGKSKSKKSNASQDKKTKAAKYKFRSNDNIGSADALDDDNFLQECFIDTGVLEILKDTGDPKRIILGRTGAGKSALLLKLKNEEERVININPETLALSYISNSTILNFFDKLGVRMDIFFKLLWRHVFVVELIKYRFEIESEDAHRNVLERFVDLFRGRKRTKALNYLEAWGSSFWEETEYRIKEITTKLENSLKNSLSVNPKPVKFTNEDISKLSEEEKAEIVQRAQHVVNQVQIRELSEIINLLDEILDDPQKKYYIVIDRLDEDWIEDRLRYKLIRSLIETAKDFGQIRHAKIILALRIDLLERIFKLTRSAGFQEEKYESLYIQLRWSREELVGLINERVNFLIQNRYAKSQILTWKDILPKNINRKPTMEYFLNRTLMQPRDVILFFNQCLRQAVGSVKISSKMVKDAEASFSRLRLRALADEWHADYPNLQCFSELLMGTLSQFKVSDIDLDKAEELCTKLVFSERIDIQEDSFYANARDMLNEAIGKSDFVKHCIQIFYHVGLIGLKLSSYETFVWRSEERIGLHLSEIDSETKVIIHTAFWRAFGTQDR